MTLSHIPAQPRLLLATVGVVFASACFGLVPLFARHLTDAGMAAHAVAFYRYVLASLFFCPSSGAPAHSARPCCGACSSGW
ncbi:MAG: hypothetical protein R3D60_00470 [Paracoccaceae bacterium]